MSNLSERYTKCPGCGEHAVHLATTGVEEFAGDMDDRLGGRSIYEEYLAADSVVELFAHLCFKCGYLVDVGIESPREKALDTREYQWSVEWPVKPGLYWFYGWPLGASPLDKPERVSAEVYLGSAGKSVRVGLGHFMYKSENVGVWTPASVPDDPTDQLKEMLEALER